MKICKANALRLWEEYFGNAQFAEDSCGGTNKKHNLICTNIYTNAEAEDKITYWIDDCLYQVQRIPGTREYQIVKLNE